MRSTERSQLISRKFLGDLGVPSLPGGFLDVLSYFSKGGGLDDVSGNTLAGMPTPNFGTDLSTPVNNGNLTAPIKDSAPPAMSRTDTANSSSKGKGKEVSFVTPQLSNISRM